jgi:hypothetical protein
MPPSSRDAAVWWHRCVIDSRRELHRCELADVTTTGANDESDERGVMLLYRPHAVCSLACRLAASSLGLRSVHVDLPVKIVIAAACKRAIDRQSSQGQRSDAGTTGGE